MSSRFAPLTILATLLALGAAEMGFSRRAERAQSLAPRSACEGARALLPEALLWPLRSGAFSGSGGADVAVHVPPGFDATRRPGLMLYFHGWDGCVAAALSADDVACSDGGPPRPGADLARQIDAARVNALLVAVELRVDAPTGEPGELAAPGGLRALLRELFADRLADALGCTLEVDALDRVVVVAHSGGYQAAAGAIDRGEVPGITEVDLLDALYGADDHFARWIRGHAERFDPRVVSPVRFVDLYTCCGGTADRSRTMARLARDMLASSGLARTLHDDDGEGELDGTALKHPVVFKRVRLAHAELPRAYVRALAEAAGFARIDHAGVPCEGCEHF